MRYDHWGVFGVSSTRIGVGWVSPCSASGDLNDADGVGYQTHTDLVFETKEDAERWITLRVLRGEGVPR